MSEVTQQIKDRLDIVEFIKGYIQVLPAGKNFKALCPFHKEKTPSFMISPERQSWHCFGACSEGGDVIKFLMKYENLEFYEALKILAERAGVALPRAGADFRRYEILFQINNEAKEFFKRNLTPEARQYLSERGLRQETIEEFELGLAPAGSDQVTRHLLQKGFRLNEIEEAGLSFRTERGTHWDRFRGRIMFPIYNGVGRVVGFTGRIFGQAAADVGKYVNSPETSIFNKSRILYGFHKTKSAIRNSQSAILVEGQMDFLMSYQAGLKNVVATSGTALTGDHLRTLRRLTDQLILSLDQDEAGQKAAERGIDLALANDFFVRVVDLRDKDPADLAKDNPEELKKLIAEAKPVREFYFNRYLPAAALTKEGLTGINVKQGARLVLAKIKNLFSNVEQALWLKELSQRTGIAESALAAEMEKLSQTAGANVKMPMAANFANNKNIAEEVSRKQLIIQRLLQLGELLPDFVREEEKQAGDQLVLRAAWENAQLAETDREKEITELTRQLKIEYCREQLAGLKTAITQAERASNEAQLTAYLIEFDKLIRELHNI